MTPRPSSAPSFTAPTFPLGRAQSARNFERHLKFTSPLPSSELSGNFTSTSSYTCSHFLTLDSELSFHFLEYFPWFHISAHAHLTHFSSSSFPTAERLFSILFRVDRRVTLASPLKYSGAVKLSCVARFHTEEAAAFWPALRDGALHDNMHRRYRRVRLFCFVFVIAISCYLVPLSFARRCIFQEDGRVVGGGW